MNGQREGYFIEMIQVGQHVKVSAVDPTSSTEVSVVGSPRMSQEALKRLAVQKLEYVMRKRGLIKEKPPGGTT